MGQNNCQTNCECLQNERPCEDEQMVMSMGAGNKPSRPNATGTSSAGSEFQMRLRILPVSKIMSPPIEDPEEREREHQTAHPITLHHTFKRINDVAEEEQENETTPGGEVGLHVSHHASIDAVFNASSGAQLAKEELMQKAELLMDNYDVITTDITFAALQARLGDGEQWKQIISSSVYDRFLKRMDLFDQVGRACCESNDGWFLAFSSNDGGSMIHGCFDAKDSSTLHYRVRVLIPTRLTNAMVVANEIELLPTWNTLIVKPPEAIGRRTAHYMAINYQMSFLGGMYKLDVLNEVRRFTDVEGGFLAEYIESCGEDHPSYRKPLRGYGRPQTKIRNIWTACGPNRTVLLQAGTLNLPFSVNKWIASTIGGIAGKFVIGGLIKNSMRSTEPDNPWTTLLASDKLGLYARLDECVDCEASRSRTPESFANCDLLHFFERRRKQSAK